MGGSSMKLCHLNYVANTGFTANKAIKVLTDHNYYNA